MAYPGIFFGGGSTNSVEDRGQRGRGSGGGSPLVRGSGGSCNLVQEISFHIQGGSNMTGTDLCVNKPHCAAAVRP